MNYEKDGNSNYLLLEENSRRKMLLENYPVKAEWGYAFKEIETVYLERIALWNGLFDNLKLPSFELNGFCFWEDFIPTQEILDCVDELEKFSNMGIGTIQFNREFRKAYLNPQRWRLNFDPGAIIGAAQKGGSLCSSLACFGAGETYEGTAAQMAFDPYLAVLEPIDEKGEKMNGFQMVAIQQNGFVCYGGKYTNGRVEDGTNLVNTLTHRILKIGYEKDTTEVLSKLEKLCKIVKSESDSDINHNHLLYSGYYKNTRNEDQLYAPEWEWSPIEDVAGAYEESVKRAGIYRFDTGLECLYDRYENYEIDDIISDIIDFREPMGTCDNCGATIYENDDHVWADFDEYGVEGIFCDNDCLGQYMINYCSRRIQDQVVVIDGELYELP